MGFALLTVLALAALPSVVSAQEQRHPSPELIDVAGERPSDAASNGGTSSVQGDSEADEEIIVFGDPTLRILREELRAAEDEVHELFNALNTEDEFDIHCHIETPTGTKIGRRICKPNYVDTATRNTGQAYLSFLRGEAGGAEAPSIAVIRYKNEILREKLTALVRENVELRGAVLRYSQISSEFESARQRILYTND